MSKVLFFLISCIFFLFPLFSSEKPTLKLMEKYYSGEKIHKEEIIELHAEAKAKLQKDNSEVNLIEYIEYSSPKVEF